jgi:hypothetical protein
MLHYCLGAQIFVWDLSTIRSWSLAKSSILCGRSWGEGWFLAREAEHPPKSAHAWIGPEKRQLGVGEIGPEAWILFSGHAFERLVGTVFLAKAGVDQDQAGRKVFALRCQRLSLGAPAHCSVCIASEVVTSTSELFEPVDRLGFFTVLEQRAREDLPGVIESVIGGGGGRHDAAAYLNRLFIPARTDEHVRQQSLHID